MDVPSCVCCRVCCILDLCILFLAANCATLLLEIISLLPSYHLSCQPLVILCFTQFLSFTQSPDTAPSIPASGQASVKYFTMPRAVKSLRPKVSSRTTNPKTSNPKLPAKTGSNYQPISASRTNKNYTSGSALRFSALTKSISTTTLQLDIISWSGGQRVV